MTLQKKKGNIILKTKSRLLIFYVWKKTRKKSTFKWIICTTKEGNCLEQRLTSRKRGRCVMHPMKPLIKLHKPPKRAANSQRSRLMQKWRLSQHHSIPFKGLDDIYNILTAPNGTQFTICQVIMSIKIDRRPYRSSIRWGRYFS